MHKGVILLMKAEDRDEAISKTNDFMERYQDDVWDWWKIGGRWMNLLAPVDKIKEYIKEKHRIVDYKEGDFGISMGTLEAKRDELQEVWENLGLKGKQPDYYNGGFNFDMPEDGEYYDAIPLSEAIDKVREWWIDPYEAGKEEEEKAKKWKLKKKDGGYLNDELSDEEFKQYSDRMYGYSLRQAADLYQQNFSFECNVYNTEEDDFSIPEELSGWYAVVVDMHN